MGNTETKINQQNQRSLTTGEKFKAGCREIFGQFITVKFWKEFASTFAKEAIKSVCIALGGTFISYGRKGRDEDISKIVNGYSSNQSGYSGSQNDRVFGNNNYNSSYNNGYSGYDRDRIPVNGNPNGDSRFPGF